MHKNGYFSLFFHYLFVVFIVAPLVVVMVMAFTDKGYLSLPTDGLSLRWFEALLDNREMLDAFLLSLKLGLASATIATILAVPAALAISRYQFPGRGTLTGLLLSPLMIPSVVLGIAFLRFFSLAQIGGSFWALCMTHVIVILPYALRLTLASTIGLEKDIEHAALSLGASRWTAFYRVILPRIQTGVVGGWMLAFIQSFDELTMTVFVSTPGTTTLPVAMYNQISQTIDPLITAISTVLIVGTLILMLILDRLVGLDRVLIGEGK
ncbi:ABC transporter permease [Pseudomonas rustica]